MIIFTLAILCIICLVIAFRAISKVLKEEKIENKKLFKRFVFSIFIVISIIPFLINEIYKYGYQIEKSYYTLWEAKDVLAFYGSFLSFLGTVVLGILALWQNKKANEINKKLLN